MSINPEEDTKPVGELSAISDMASFLGNKYKELSIVEDQAKRIKEEIHRIESSDLPELMTELGVEKFTLNDGSSVNIKPIIRGNLPSLSSIAKQKDPEKRAEMMNRYKQGIKYLIKHKAASLVNFTLVADLGKDSKKLSMEAKKALKELGIKAETSEGVHPASLSSWIKERMEAGKDIDHDLFEVFCGKKAEIKSPPKKRTK